MKHVVPIALALTLFASRSAPGQPSQPANDIHPGVPPTAFQPGQVWPDQNGIHINAHGGGILHHEGTYFWFGEHKIQGDAGNYAQVGVHVYASKDLYNWKDEGIALRVSEDPSSDLAKGCILERPKVLFCRKTGRFVMWFHLEPKGRGYGGARSGVAVADRVTGPFRFLESFRPNAGVWPQNAPVESRRPLSDEETAQLKKLSLSGGPVPGYPTNLIFRRNFAGGQMARDMTLFQDDDGSAYHVFASEDNGVLHISQLADDYQKPAGRYIRVFAGDFNEAPALFKHRGRYYLFSSGCTGWAPNAARLAVADSIWGPWKKLGNPCRGTKEQLRITFDSQSTFVLPVAGQPDAFIFMGDRWRPANAIDGCYVWLPIRFRDGQPYVEWLDRWDLKVFNQDTH